MLNTNSLRIDPNRFNPTADGGSLAFNRFSRPLNNAVAQVVDPEIERQFKKWQKESIDYIMETMKDRANNDQEAKDFVDIQLRKYPIFTAPATPANIEEAKKGNEWSEDGFRPKQNGGGMKPKANGRGPKAKGRGPKGKGALLKLAEGVTRIVAPKLAPPKGKESVRVKRDRAEREKYRKAKEKKDQGTYVPYLRKGKESERVKRDREQREKDLFERFYQEELRKQPTDITEGARQRRAKTMARKRVGQVMP